MIYLVSLVPIMLTLLAVAIFVAVGARPDDEDAPSALLPALGGLMLLFWSGGIWIWIGAHAGGVA